MSTEPRAARRGQKVSSGGMSNKAASSDFSPTPTPPTLSGPIDLSSFLAEVSSSPNSAAAGGGGDGGDKAASQQTLSSTVGVVRGRARDHSAAIKERDPGASQSEVEAKLRKQLAAIRDGAKNESSKSDNSGGVDDVSVSEINKATVSLISGSGLPGTALKIVNGDKNARVLVVSSLEEVVSSQETVKKEGGGGAAQQQCGYWYGSERQPAASDAPTTAGIRLWYTTFRAMVSFLAVFVRDEKCACPFTHIFVVAKDGKCNYPLFDACLSVLCSQIEKNAKTTWKDTRVLVCGLHAAEEIQRLVGAELSVQSLVKVVKNEPLRFTPSEAAALVGAVVKEHAPTSVSLRRMPGSVPSLPSSLVEHGVSVAASVLAKVLQVAGSEKVQLRCAVIGAEMSDMQTAIQGALPAAAFEIYTDHREFAAHQQQTDKSKKPTTTASPILLLGRALSASVSSQLKFHLVIDCGTERRAVIPPQAEMQFPIKVVVAPSRRELAARANMAGWCSSSSSSSADATGGILFSTIESAAPAATAAGSPSGSPLGGEAGTAAASPREDGTAEVDADEEDLLDPVCDAVLQLAQYGLDLSHLVKEQRKGRNAQLQLALPFLTDLGYITSVQAKGADGADTMESVVTTFLGEVAARTGLPPDFAYIVVHGLVVGMADACAFVATAAARPFRAGNNSSNSSSHSDSLDCGDTIEDAISLAEGAACNSAEQIADLCATKKLHPEAFENALRVVRSVRQGLEDFNTSSFGQQQQRSSSSSSSSSSVIDTTAIKRQLTENVNLFVAFLASALARRTVIVRHEGDERTNMISRGNLLFTHTAKEVVPNRFVPSHAAWKKDMVIVCSSIQNTPTRLLGSGCTAVSNDYFMGSLFALSPTLAFEKINARTANQNDGRSICFSVALNRLEKTSLLSQANADEFLNMREKWCTLLSYVQLRRATGAKTGNQFRDAIAKHMDKRFVLERAQSEFVAELTELIADFHVHVPLGSAAIGRDPSKLRSHVLRSPPPPSTLSSIAVPSDFAVSREIATCSAANAGAASASSAVDESSKNAGGGADDRETSDVEDEEVEGVIIDDD